MLGWDMKQSDPEVPTLMYKAILVILEHVAGESKDEILQETATGLVDQMMEKLTVPIKVSTFRDVN